MITFDLRDIALTKNVASKQPDAEEKAPAQKKRSGKARRRKWLGMAEEFGEEEWLRQIKGYDIQLQAYTRDCSRLTLRAQDCIAQRPGLNIVFHDVSYIELPLKAHNVRARKASEEELTRVKKALGENFRVSSVVAFESRGEVFLVEYGFAQILVS